MTKKLKLWTVVSVIVIACGAGALAPASQGARAQEAPGQSLTPAETLTITLLQQIVAQLVELNRNIARLPAQNGQ